MSPLFDQPKPKPAMTAQRLRNVLPAVWELMRPRRGLLALGFVLMVINRVSGLVLPYSTKFLIDSVIAKHHVELLRRLVSVVLVATYHSGNHVVRADPIVIEGGPASDRGTSPESAGPHFASAGRVLRFQQDWHPGLAHHDRCGRSAEPAGHRTGRSGRRAAHFRHCDGRALPHQPGHDHPGVQFSALLRHRTEQGIQQRFVRFSGSAEKSMPK